MSEKKKPLPAPKTDRFTMFTRDEEGNIFGVVSVHRDNILDVTYSGIEHTISITLAGQFGNGYSSYEPMPNYKVETGAGGKKNKVPTGSYTMQVLYNQQNYNPSFTLKDEIEMERFWNWLGHEEGMSWDALVEIRKAMQERIAKAKEEAEKRAKEEADKKAEAEQSPSKLVNMHGAALNENTINDKD